MTNSINQQKRNAYVLLNPVAGTMDSEFVETQLQQVFTENQISFHIHHNSKGEDLHQRVKQALKEGYNEFFAVGGDGTVSGVASGLVGTSVPVTIIPTGTANVIAKILKIPVDRKHAFTWWLDNTRLKKIDAMRVEDRYYFLTISAGTTSKALQNVRREEKRKYGSFAYWLHGFERLLRVSPYQFYFQIDEQEYSTRGIEWLAINGGIEQFNPLPAEPTFQIDDGKLSVCQVKVKNPGDYFELVFGVFSGHPIEIPQTNCQDAYHTIRLSSLPSLPIQADGELIGDTPFDITLQPKAVGFLVPAESKD